MNRDDILAFLSALFGNFLVHESLAQEITAIIERSGFEKSSSISCWFVLGFLVSTA